MLLRRSDLAPTNDALAKLTPLEILRLVWEAFGDRAAILSSMQRAGTILCHMADRARLGMDVVFVDTGVLHPETLATRDELAATHPHLRVKTLAPLRSFLEQTRAVGLLYLDKEGQERCCDLRKSEPLRAVRGQYDVLVGALRREEGGRRSLVGCVEIDDDLGLLRVHPLAFTTRAELDRYRETHDGVVINPLHHLGFAPTRTSARAGGATWPMSRIAASTRPTSPRNRTGPRFRTASAPSRRPPWRSRARAEGRAVALLVGAGFRSGATSSICLC